MNVPRHDWREVAAMPGRRLFIAVPLASATTAAVAEVVEQVRSLDEGPRAQRHRGRARVRWVRLEGLHVTLRFLGPTTDGRIEALKDVLEEVANGSRPFHVVIGGGGAFPDLDRPRALWLGLADGAAELTGLAAALEERLVSAGWPAADKPFRPHLTVARVEGAAAAGTARRLLDAASALEVASPVDRIVLFESVTGQGPARYQALTTAALGGGDGLHGSASRR